VTGTEYVELAKRMLGDRDEIGITSDINEAVLYALRETIRRLANIANHDWHILYREYTSTITTLDYIFTLPAPANNPDIESVKSILGGWLERDNTAHDLEYITKRRKQDFLPLTSEAQTSSQPRFFGRFDDLLFWVHPFPDQDYKINMTVSVVPKEMTINEEQPLGRKLDATVAAGMAAELFRELQEPEDAFSWEGHFVRLRDEAIATEKDQPDWTPKSIGSSFGRGFKPGNFLGNPFWHGGIHR